MGTLFDVTGQVALVTGASRGFGRSIAGALAGAGADLVVTSRKLALDLTDGDWEQTLDTNLTGCFRVAQVVGRHMVARRQGRIVNIASMLAAVTIPERAAYASSKGGLVQMTRTLAVEWAPSNVRVNAICPGPFLTDLNKVILDDPEKVKFFMDRMPMKRFGRPEELHGAVIFFASEASSFITGTTLYIDGGWTAL